MAGIGRGRKPQKRAWDKPNVRVVQTNQLMECGDQRVHPQHPWGYVYSNPAWGETPSEGETTGVVQVRCPGKQSDMRMPAKKAPEPRLRGKELRDAQRAADQPKPKRRGFFG